MPNIYANPRQNGFTRKEFVIALIVMVWLISLSAPFSFRNIKLGMTRSEAIDAVGKPPLYEEKGLSLCASPPWDGDCSKASSSGAVTWLIWGFGLDSFGVVGLDGAGKVVYSETGMK